MEGKDLDTIEQQNNSHKGFHSMGVDALNTYTSSNKWSVAIALAAMTVVAIPFVTAINSADTPAKDYQKQEKAFMEENPFNGISLAARSAYVLDVVNEKPLYALNENAQVPLASVTKLMTALIASDNIPYSAIVKIDARDIAQEGDSGLYVGERWRLRDILDFTLLTSSNDGASAIAAVVGAFGTGTSTNFDIDADRSELKSRFVDVMNAKAQELGLYDTYFLNETGLDVNSVLGGAYGSARDIAHLLSYMINNKPNILEATTLGYEPIASLDNIVHVATNTNSAIGMLPVPIASKTGYTELSGGNLAVAIDAGFMRPIIIVVLGSTQDERFADVSALASAAIKSLSYFDNLGTDEQME